jgi:guanylate kinase
MSADMKMLPCLVMIGLSGAGKSISNEWIEHNYCARRVRRFTTRPSRLDDDSSLVIHMDSSAAESNDFVYYGWGNTTYWIRESDILEIQKRQEVPLVELGDPGDALKFREHFKHVSIICLWRNLAIESMKSILTERKMEEAEVKQRISSAQSDLSNLQEKKGQFDLNIYNNENKDVLFNQWKTFLNSLGIAKR